MQKKEMDAKVYNGGKFSRENEFWLQITQWKHTLDDL